MKNKTSLLKSGKIKREPANNNFSGLNPFPFIAGFMLLVAYFLISTKLEPALAYFKQQPLFLTDSFFLHKYLQYPGNFIQYISLFVVQFWGNNVLGSLIILIAAGIVSFLSYQLFKNYSKKPFLISLSLMPVFFILLTHLNYKTSFDTDIVIISALLLSLLFIKLISKYKLIYKLLFIILISTLLFFFFGATSLQLFSILVTIDLLYKKDRNRAIIIPLLFVSIVLLPYLTSLFSPYIGFRKAISGVFVINKTEISRTFQILATVTLPATILLQLAVNKLIDQKKISSPTILISNILIGTILIGTMFFLFNNKNIEKEKNKILLHYYSANEKWDDVLKVAQKNDLNERLVIFEINRALYHKGALLNRAFSAPQYWGNHGLILTTYYSRDVLMHCSDLYYEIGHIRSALHWAYEAQTKYDNSPAIMKRIVLCNLITGDYNTAEKFLKILSNSHIYKDWATLYMPYLYNDQKVNSDPVLSSKRKLMPKTDFFTNSQNPQQDLFQIIDENPANQMAFEYFITYSLLTHDLARVIRLLPNLKILGYTKIPTHIEEAIMLFKTINQEFPVELGNYEISEKTLANFNNFSKLLMKYKNNRMEGQKEFARDFGNTYWYYIQFVSPITTKREFKQR
jgi:hypothetical protein